MNQELILFVKFWFRCNISAVFAPLIPTFSIDPIELIEELGKISVIAGQEDQIIVSASKLSEKRK